MIWLALVWYAVFGLGTYGWFLFVEEETRGRVYCGKWEILAAVLWPIGTLFMAVGAVLWLVRKAVSQ